MKSGLEQLLGKTIKAVLVNKGRGQLFLVFSDETYFEFYGWGTGLVNWTRAVSRGGIERVLAYVGAEAGETNVIASDTTTTLGRNSQL